MPPSLSHAQLISPTPHSLGAAFVIANKNPSQEFPFWGYLSGVAMFWGGWTTLFAWPVYNNYYFSALYFVVNVLLLAATTYTKQRVFLVFGSIGVFWYVEYLVNRLLWNSWYLPLVLTVIGLIFIGLAVYYSGRLEPKKMNSCSFLGINFLL